MSSDKYYGRIKIFLGINLIIIGLCFLYSAFQNPSEKEKQNDRFIDEEKNDSSIKTKIKNDSILYIKAISNI